MLNKPVDITHCFGLPTDVSSDQARTSFWLAPVTMPTVLSNHFTTLHSQHSLQHADLLAIYHLAILEEMDDSIDSFSFEELLGLTVYLFVTTQSQDSREQLSGLLQKFGSAAVLPLLRVLSRKDAVVSESLPVLAQKSLNEMGGYPLVIGLDQVLTHSMENDLKTVALEVLRQRLQLLEQGDLLLLQQVLSETTLELVEDLLLGGIGFAVNVPTDNNAIHFNLIADIAALEHKIA